MIYLHFLVYCMHIKKCSCHLVSILSYCDDSSWLHEHTHTHKMRLQSGNYFFFLFLLLLFFASTSTIMAAHYKNIYIYIEKKISKIDYVNDVETKRKVMFFSMYLYIEKHSSAFDRFL